MTFEYLAGLIITAIVMLVGLGGSVIPGIPGAPLILAAAIGHKMWFGEQSASYFVVGLLVFLTILSLLVDFLASTLGAKKMGASWRGMLGAILGAIIGMFFSLPGLILGPLLGAFFFELAGGKEWRDSAQAGAGALIGFILGAVGKVVCCVAMIALFFFSAIWHSGSSNPPLEPIHPTAAGVFSHLIQHGV